jgi:ATP:ADP antiporter, AAA family
MELKTAWPFPSVHPGERPRLLRMVAAFMCVAAAGIIARTAGATLFLNAFDPSLLPAMYAGGAILLTASSFLLALLISRSALLSLIRGVALLGAGLAIALRLALLGGWFITPAVVYLATELLAKLPVILFWGFAALLFNPREAKRLFVWIGVGGTLACAIAGASIRPFARWFSTGDLLIVVALLLVAFGVIISRSGTLEKRPAPAKNRAMAAPSSPRYYLQFLGETHPRNLAILAMLSTTALLAVDYVFKASARLQYAGDDLAVFFGTFHSFTSISALLFQLFLVHAILNRGGVALGAVILPVALAVTATGAAVTGSFNWIVATKFLDPLFDFTINAATFQLLYLGVRTQSRAQVRTFVDGISRPVAVVVFGLILMVAVTLVPIRAVIGLTVCLALAWIAVAVLSHRSYLEGLLASISTRRFDLSSEVIGFRDSAFERHFRQALRESSDEEIPYLIGVLPDLGEIDWTPEYRLLLEREPVEIKLAAIGWISERGDMSDLPSLVRHLHHDDPAVRRETVKALPLLAGAEMAQGMIRPMLEDHDVSVRAAAVAQLLSIGDLDSLVAACVTLKELLVSEDERCRKAAADALAEIEHRGLTRPLMMLLRDPRPEVRKAALQACSSHPGNELIPTVMELLDDPEVAIFAVDTLVSFGEPVLDALDDLEGRLGALRTSEGRARVPTVIARIGGSRAAGLLMRLFHSGDLELRSAAISRFPRLILQEGSSPIPASEIEVTVRREIEECGSKAEMASLLAGVPGAELLHHTLREEESQHLDNMLQLLHVLEPRLEPRSLHSSLVNADGGKRGEAIEILDNVVRESIKRPLLTLLEPVASTSTERAVPHASIAMLLGDGSAEWTAAGAAYFTGVRGASEIAEGVARLLRHPSPAVRETALHAFIRLVDPERALQVCRDLSVDASESVRRVALSFIGGKGDAATA